MPVIVPLGTVLNSLIGSTNSESADPTAEQQKKNVEICTQNLRAIGEAIHAYQKEHGDFPEWLSDLQPKHLADSNILICPADEESGKTIYSMNTDPRIPVSYGYQFHPEYRDQKNRQRAVYGDAMPLVRCRHHANEDFDCLNLSFSSKIYKSSTAWEFTPEDLYGNYEEAITVLEDALTRHADDKRFSHLHHQLGRLYSKTGNKQAADAIIALFQSVMEPGLPGYRTLFGLLDDMERYEDMLVAFKEAERQHPDAQPILWRLGYIYRKLGNIELADVYDRRADPIIEMIGKPVPDFSKTDLNGNPISLRDYRGKVVLLDFWAVWCGFCALKLPHIKKAYDTYKDKGFDVIGVSLDATESDMHGFIKENDLQWRQIYIGNLRNNPFLQQYNVTGLPVQWLIDRDGKLITHKVSGKALGQLVVDALKG